MDEAFVDLDCLVITIFSPDYCWGFLGGEQRVVFIGEIKAKRVESTLRHGSRGNKYW